MTIKKKMTDAEGNSTPTEVDVFETKRKFNMPQMPDIDIKQMANKGFSTAGKGLKHAVETVQEKGKETIDRIEEIRIAHQKQADQPDPEKSKKEKKPSLDDQLTLAVEQYNAEYTRLNDLGQTLFTNRQRSVDLTLNVEKLINSIANHPKSFDTDIEEIKLKRMSFKEVCDFAKEELEAAQKSAIGVGAGAAGGMAVASLAPSAAMWIATTFGTASTGTAISTLSGAAATNAALAWLGGGALTAGGGGVAAGQAFLAMAGPVGWSIAGATLLTSIVLFANKKVKLAKEKAGEIEAVLKNTESLKESTLKVQTLLNRTDALREQLLTQYDISIAVYGRDFQKLSEEEQLGLGALVNNAKSLAHTLNENVEA